MEPNTSRLHIAPTPVDLAVLKTFDAPQDGLHEHFAHVRPTAPRAIADNSSQS